jgi:hypothetical protein
MGEESSSATKRSHPSDRQWTDVVAREVLGDEHARVWDTATAASPGYNGYLKTLSRPVPILRLERK